GQGARPGASARNGRLAPRRRGSRSDGASAARGGMGLQGRRSMTDTDAVPPAGEVPATRSGFVALIGAPNAGKSTLLNRLVGAKVSIVTHKVQTTRALVRGIATHGATQIVFVDTPGIFRPKRRLD